MKLDRADREALATAAVMVAAGCVLLLVCALALGLAIRIVLVVS